ncbi:MAG: hypothetical protein NXI31_07630 [bacterium]|nr:hypothetical protein [bacterium]
MTNPKIPPTLAATLALTLAGSGPALAQIPADTALVFESTQLLEPYYKLVDVFGRGQTTLREQNAFMAVTSVAVDPVTNGQFFWIGAAASLPGTWRSQIEALARFGQGIWGPWSQTPATRVAVGASRIVTLESSGTLQAHPKVTFGGPPVINLTINQANDIAIVGELLYTSTSGGGQAPVFEHDLANNTNRTVGSYADVASIAVSPFGVELALGTQNGDILRVDPVSGAINATQPTGLARITAVGYTRFNTLVWTDGSTLWSELSPTTPLYTSPTSILDFSVAIATGPSVTRYGEGCGAGATSTWTVNGEPALGNSAFAIGLDNAPPNAPGLLTLGTSRTRWNAANATLPFELRSFGLPGCSLLASPEANLFVVTNAGGRFSQTVPIPSSSAFAGLEFVAQAFVQDNNLGTLGFVPTEGVAFVVN